MVNFPRDKYRLVATRDDGTFVLQRNEAPVFFKDASCVLDEHIILAGPEPDDPGEDDSGDDTKEVTVEVIPLEVDDYRPEDDGGREMHPDYI